MAQIDGRELCPRCFSELPENGICPACGAQHDPAAGASGCLETGTILMGRYLVGRVLGRGGFGVTYLAYDLKESRRVAVKEYLPDTLAYRMPGNTKVFTYSGAKQEDFRLGSEKFYEEAQTVARFSGHPNIIHVYDFFYENDTAYFSMEYMEGGDLRQYIERQGRRLEPAAAVQLLLPILDALILIHSVNVLHRDISPDNIYITEKGTAKLLDFGSARQVLSEQSKSLSVILKPGFAPVEQYQSHGKQGPWTDVYAYAATLYYCLTGQVPTSAMDRVEQDGLRPASAFNPGVSQRLDHVLQKALAVRAVRRYQSAAELRAELGAAVQPAAGRPESLAKTAAALGGRAVRGAARRRLDPKVLLAGAGVAMLCLVLAVTLLVRRGGQSGAPVGGAPAPQTVEKTVPGQAAPREGNTNANLANYGNFAAADGWVYYTAGKSNQKIYRMREDGTEAELLYEQKQEEESSWTGLSKLNVAGDTLYFDQRNTSEDLPMHEIYGMPAAGGQAQPVDLPALGGSYLKYQDGFLYCGGVGSAEKSFYRVDVQTGEFVDLGPAMESTLKGTYGSYFCVNELGIFYCSVVGVHWVSLDGTQQKLFSLGEEISYATDLTGCGDSLYIKGGVGDDTIYSAALPALDPCTALYTYPEESQKKLLGNSFNFCGKDMIIWSPVIEDGTKMFRLLRLDLENEMHGVSTLLKLEAEEPDGFESRGYQLAVLGDWIYYYQYNADSKIYRPMRLSADGQTVQQLPTP